LYLTGVGYDPKWGLPINQAGGQQDVQSDSQSNIQVFI
jgi:hypothetical protein